MGQFEAVLHASAMLEIVLIVASDRRTEPGNSRDAARFNVIVTDEPWNAIEIGIHHWIVGLFPAAARSENRRE
jgi:hypothetical protein